MLCDISLTTTYSPWLIPLCLLLGFALAFFAYYRNEKFSDIEKWKVYLMMTFRFLTLSIIAILLLEPVLNTQFRSVEQPVIIIAQDRSASMTFNQDSTTLLQNGKAIDEWASGLGGNFDVRRYSFGDEVSEGFSPEYGYKETDFSTLLREMEERYLNRNVGAMIIVSDGLYNKGTNPLYSKHNYNFPVFTIAVGDTARKKDIILKALNHNKIAYLGNQFPVEAVVSAFGCKGISLNATIYLEGKKVASQEIEVNTNDFSIKLPFLLEAAAPGTQHYRVELTKLDDEKNTLNNGKSFFIEVLDGRQKVLILANAPHPDIGAIVSSLSSFDKYKTDIFIAKKFNGNTEGYDLIIFHDLPSAGFPANQVSRLLEKDKPALFILGEQTQVNQFNTLNTGLTIAGNIRKFNESRAIYQEDFSLFTLNSTLLEKIGNYPPLTSPFGDYKISIDHDHLFKQRIGIVASEQPLITFTRKENQKTGIICGEGIWRWKLWNYQKTRSHDHFNELTGKIVQYLSVKEDKSRFRVNGKNSFFENEAIVFEAELYNQTYELINDPDVDITFTDENGKKYPFLFNRTSNAYSLNAGTLPVGNYKYTARVKNGDPTLVKSGSFSVVPLLIESLNTIADHDLLFQLSKKYNGEMFYTSQLDELSKKIAENEEIRPVSYNEDRPLELIHLKWLFFLLLVFLSAEWYMRKRNGTY